MEKQVKGDYKIGVGCEILLICIINCGPAYKVIQVQRVQQDTLISYFVDDYNFYANSACTILYIHINVQ